MNKTKVFVQLGTQEEAPNNFLGLVLYKIKPDSKNIVFEVRAYGKSALEAAENAMAKYKKLDLNQDLTNQELYSS